MYRPFCSSVVTMHPSCAQRSRPANAKLCFRNFDLCRPVTASCALWNKSADPLVPKKGLGCRAECFQSHTVVLQPSPSCSITSFRVVCKPSNGNPHQGFTCSRSNRLMDVPGPRSVGAFRCLVCLLQLAQLASDCTARP